MKKIYKDEDYDFEPIITVEEFKRNRKRALRKIHERDSEIKRNIRMKIIIGGLGIFLIIATILMMNFLSKEEDKTIERASKECIQDNRVIKVKYAEDGERYFVCGDKYE